MTKKNDILQPRMVKSHDIHLDEAYAQWIAELKHRYRAAQIKASVKVNHLIPCIHFSAVGVSLASNACTK